MAHDRADVARREAMDARARRGLRRRDRGRDHHRAVVLGHRTRRRVVGDPDAHRVQTNLRLGRHGDVEHDVEARGRPELPSRGRADSRAHHHRALLLRSQRLVAARAG